MTSAATSACVFGFTAYDENSDGDGAIVTSGTGTGTDTMVNSIIDNLGTTGQVTPVEVPTLGDRYNVNVPIAEAAGRFSLAVLNDDYLVDLELTALEAEGRGEIVSTPRVITANQKEARIEQGVEIPISSPRLRVRRRYSSRKPC